LFVLVALESVLNSGFDTGSQYLCLSQPWTYNPPASTSWVAGIIDVFYHMVLVVSVGCFSFGGTGVWTQSLTSTLTSWAMPPISFPLVIFQVQSHIFCLSWPQTEILLPMPPV
jgi:hypothetical protein